MKLSKLLFSGIFCAQVAVASAGISPIPSFESFEEDSIKDAPNEWFHLDRSKDNFRGVSTLQAYELLKGRTSRTIVVGVIDSGVDIEHEDLKDVLWTNKKEIAGNGIDDDKNGYIDDIHGWNFIGGKDGKHVDKDTYELTREYKRLKSKYEGKVAADFKGDDKKECEYFLKVQKKYKTDSEKDSKIYENIKNLVASFENADKVMKEQLGKDEYTEEDVNGIKSEDDKVNAMIKFRLFAFKQGFTADRLNDAIKHYKANVEYRYNLDFNPRTIVGDDYSNINERYYGNGDVEGPDPMHGTHVAGIIGAKRGNGIGMDGIADNVEIMVIRTVPDGDERDKDVANSIYYAVDNGAHIINMSFGKAYSNDKAAVDAAFKYAESKGVLLVHAAGNDSKDIDVKFNFPNRKYIKKSSPNTWLEVGASSWGGNDNFVGSFSNYGRKTVDIIAPVVDIYSTIPDSKYKKLNGTSMACPVTAGVAALVMSYFPDLTAKQVKKILMKSSVKYKKEVIAMPGGKKDETVRFKKLSRSAGIVNALNAVKLAMKKSKK